MYWCVKKTNTCLFRLVEFFGGFSSHHYLYFEVYIFVPKLETFCAP